MFVLEPLLSAVAVAAFVLFTITTGVFLFRLCFVPLAFAHKYFDTRRRKEGNHGAYSRTPSISVVVPAYNEEATLHSCVSSISATNYPNLEILIVDDGSKDKTEEIGTALDNADPRVRYIRQKNAGKGAALNRGYRESTGEFLMFIDADSVFTKDTIPEMLRGFRHERVGAVCGDDRPVNLDRTLTRFLALITHVGTALVRRAFDVLGCVPVVSGNCGSFRREALDELTGNGPGPLREDTIGEDLEMTWRFHRQEWDVTFAPNAIVYAESPSSFKALWKQRVRWARGLLQALKYHWRCALHPRHGAFMPFLIFTIFAMALLPVIQLVSLAIIIGMGVGGTVIRFVNRNQGSINSDEEISLLGEWLSEIWTWKLLWVLLFGSGILVSLILLIIAMAMAKSLKDLRFVWTIPIWPFYSTAMSMTMVRAWYLELRNKPQVWNKPERTGVITNREATALNPPSTTTPQPQRLTNEPQPLYEQNEQALQPLPKTAAQYK